MASSDNYKMTPSHSELIPVPRLYTKHDLCHRREPTQYNVSCLCSNFAGDGSIACCKWFGLWVDVLQLSEISLLLLSAASTSSLF